MPARTPSCPPMAAMVGPASHRRWRQPSGFPLTCRFSSRTGIIQQSMLRPIISLRRGTWLFRHRARRVLAHRVGTVVRAPRQRLRGALRSLSPSRSRWSTLGSVEERRMDESLYHLGHRGRFHLRRDRGLRSFPAPPFPRRSATCTVPTLGRSRWGGRRRRAIRRCH